MIATLHERVKAKESSIDRPDRCQISLTHSSRQREMHAAGEPGIFECGIMSLSIQSMIQAMKVECWWNVKTSSGGRIQMYPP